MYVFPDVGSLIGFVVVIFASLGIVGMLLIKYYYYEKAREEERKTQMLGKVISSMADILKNTMTKFEQSKKERESK
jgi:hypothetical protein